MAEWKETSMAGRINKQDVEQFGSSWFNLLAGLGKIFEQQRFMREVDQARQRSTRNIPLTIPGAAFGNPLGYTPDLETQAPMQDNARFIQALLPFLGRNPQAQTQFQAQMAMRPEYSFINQEGG